MSDKKYSIKTDRKFTELAIANALVNKPNLCNEIDESKLKLENVRMIHRFISASTKRGDSLSPEVIKSHLRANIGNTASQETHQTISEICTERNVVDNEFESLKNHLNQISTRENVVRLGESIVDRAVGGDDLLEICQIAEHITDAKSNLAGKFEVTSLGQAMDMTMNNMVKDRESDVTSSFEFHIKRLNKLIGGMFATDLIVVAARPAVGKTAFGLNIIYHQPEAAYGVISSEMSTEQLSKRMIATETGIDSFKLRTPKLLSEPEFAEVGIAASKLKGRRAYIEDKGNINISEIRERIQEWVSIYGVNVVLVDYIQRIDSDRRHSSKAEEVGYVAKRLKEIAKEFGVCIVAIAQINRDAQKDNRPPTMADIKASGDIEQEADIIIILHKQSMGTDDANFDCIVEGIVEKNRHGRIGTVLMNYAPSRIDFSDASDEQIDNYILGEYA